MAQCVFKSLPPPLLPPVSVSRDQSGCEQVEAHQPVPPVARLIWRETIEELECVLQLWTGALQHARLEFTEGGDSCTASAGFAVPLTPRQFAEGIADRPKS